MWLLYVTTPATHKACVVLHTCTNTHKHCFSTVCFAWKFAELLSLFDTVDFLQIKILAHTLFYLRMDNGT